MIIDDFKNKFIIEANDLINSIETSILGLETTPDDKDIINEVFRVMHTLKGAATMFGFNLVEKITHQLESVYDKIRGNELNVTNEIVDITLEVIDILKIIFESNNNLNELAQKQFNDLLFRVCELSGTELDLIPTPQLHENTSNKQAEKKMGYYYISYMPSEDVYFRGANPYGIFFELVEIGKYKAIPYLDKFLSAENIDIDKFHLYWDIFLETEASLDDVRDVFMFYNENEAIVYEINVQNLDDKDFLKNYNSIPKVKLNAKEIEKILNELIRGENVVSGNILESSKKSDEIISINETPTTVKIEKPKDTSKKNTSIKVSTEKLDYLIANVSEFVILYSRISYLSQASNDEYLTKLIKIMGKLSKKLRDNALELRLVPINELSLKMQRLIRDLSKKLDKNINFITEGMDTELDKTIVDNIEEPIMHIIRNSLDHGIEDKATRKANHKSETGIVRLTAFYSGAYVFIQIQDDGKGIDLDKIRNKALEKGLISGNAELTKRETYDLIFLPGFTTVDSASVVSGRGVGMDVVKQKINELRGEIDIDSEVGLGTIVTIKLPLTLSIIDTLKVKIGELQYLVPLATVEKCIRINYNEIYALTQKQYEYESALLPVIILRNELEINDKLPDKGSLIIIKQYEKKYCLLVDEVLGDHQAVVKPLGDLHKKHSYFSGASIMGDGSLALILNTNKILTLNRENQYLN